MLNSKNVLIWFCLSIIPLVTFTTKCTKPMEAQMIAGFDIQKYTSPNSYQSLYIQKEQTDFVIVSKGKRSSGQLTDAEHEELLDLLQEKNREVYLENSLLGSDTLPYPYISIRERPEQTSSFGSPFFVILALDSPGEVPSQLIDLVDELLVKYGG